MGSTKARAIAFFAFFYVPSMLALSSDPTQLQNFCVGTSNPDNAVHVDGHICKNPAEVTAEDFYFKGIDRHDGSGNTQSTLVDAANLPGLNTLGVSMLRGDFGPGGMAPPHFHPHATEVVTALDGTLQVGFIASNKVFAKVLYPGDVFVIPRGLVHTVRNHGEEHAAVITGFSSDNPSRVVVATPVALGPSPQPA